MAGQNNASSIDASPAGFGAWLRGLREEKKALLRIMAAAANMDPSHLGKAERGERLPTLEQIHALAKYLNVPPDEMRGRYLAAKVLIECDGDTALAADTAHRLQEHASAHLVNKRK